MADGNFRRATAIAHVINKNLGRDIERSRGVGGSCTYGSDRVDVGLGSHFRVPFSPHRGVIRQQKIESRWLQ